MPFYARRCERAGNLAGRDSTSRRGAAASCPALAGCLGSRRVAIVDPGASDAVVARPTNVARVAVRVDTQRRRRDARLRARQTEQHWFGPADDAQGTCDHFSGFGVSAPEMSVTRPLNELFSDVRRTAVAPTKRLLERFPAIVETGYAASDIRVAAYNHASLAVDHDRVRHAKGNSSPRRA